MNKAVKYVSSNNAPVTINSYQQPQEQIQQKFLLLKETAVKYSNKRCNCKCSKTAAATTDTSTKIMQNSQLQLLEKQTQQQVGDLYQQQLLHKLKPQQHFNELNDGSFNISIDYCCRKKYPSIETVKSAVAPTEAPADQSTIDQLLSSAGNCVCFSNECNSSKNCCSSIYHNTPSCSPINVPNTSKTSQPKVLSKANKNVIFCDVGESCNSELDKDALYLLAATKPSSIQALSQQRQRKLQKVVVCNSNNFLKVSLFLLLLLLLLSKAILILATAIAFSCTSILLLKQQHQSLQCARRNALCSFLLSSLLYAQLLSLTPQTLGSNGDSNVINVSNVSTNSSSESGGSSSALLGLEMTFGNAAAIVPHDNDEQQQKKLTSLHDVTQLMATLDSSSSSSNGGSNSLFNAKATNAPDALLAGGGSNIVKFISRDHVLERAHIGTEPETAQVTENVDPQLHSSGCHSCQVREKAKQDNLESIKNHILMRLKLTKPPNITAPIIVPYNIIEDFYKNVGANGNGGGTTIRKESSKTVAYARHYHASFSDSSSSSSSSSGADATDMQGDDPFSYSTAAVAGTAQRQQLLHPYGLEMDDAWQPQLLGEMDDTGGGGGSSKASEKATKTQQWNFDEALEVEESEDDDFEEEFYSQVNSVYVFPTTSRLRHNRKLEILNFQLDGDQTQSATISHAFVHVYIRGHDWMRKHLLDPPVLQSFSTENDGGGVVDMDNDEVVITIHQAVRRQNATNFTHTIKLSETRHKIPNGTGQWVRIELQQLASFWTNSRNSTQGIVVKGAEPWMQTYIFAGSSASTDNGLQNKTNHVFIELLTKKSRKGRHKRSTSLDCSESDNEVRCCRYPLRVNFSNFGWNWVVAPTSFNAYFCNGECKLGFLEKHAHTHLASLSTSAQPCCSPTKMSPLKLLYFNNDNSLVLSSIPNMSVEKCSCS